MIQYPETSVIEPRSRGVLDARMHRARRQDAERQLACRRATQLSSARCRLAQTPLGAKNRVREKSNFVSRFKLIWVLGSLGANISISENQKSCIVPPSRLGQRDVRVVTNVGRDAVDAVVSLDERR